MNNPKFFTKRGLLTKYALACGYVEQYESAGNRLSLTLEHNVFHVKGFIDDKHIWHSFDNVTEARSFIKSHKLPRKES